MAYLTHLQIVTATRCSLFTVWRPCVYFADRSSPARNNQPNYRLSNYGTFYLFSAMLRVPCLFPMGIGGTICCIPFGHTENWHNLISRKIRKGGPSHFYRMDPPRRCCWVSRGMDRTNKLYSSRQLRVSYCQYVFAGFESPHIVCLALSHLISVDGGISHHSVIRDTATGSPITQYTVGLWVYFDRRSMLASSSLHMFVPCGRCRLSRRLKGWLF